MGHNEHPLNMRKLLNTHSIQLNSFTNYVSDNFNGHMHTIRLQVFQYQKIQPLCIG